MLQAITVHRLESKLNGSIAAFQFLFSDADPKRVFFVQSSAVASTMPSASINNRQAATAFSVSGNERGFGSVKRKPWPSCAVLRSVCPACRNVEATFKRGGVLATRSRKAIVNIDGTVGEVVLIRGVDRDVDAAALEAVRKFQFNPTTLMGVPVRSVVTFEMKFLLR